MTNPVTQALTAYDEAAIKAREINQAKKAADSAKRAAYDVAVAALEEAELDGANATIDGKKVNFSKYEIVFAHLQSVEEFKEWAAQEDGEAYFEGEPRVRQDLLNALVRQRLDDGEPLPPGVGIYVETRLSRTAK